MGGIAGNVFFVVLLAGSGRSLGEFLKESGVMLGACLVGPELQIDHGQFFMGHGKGVVCGNSLLKCANRLRHLAHFPFDKAEVIEVG